MKKSYPVVFHSEKEGYSVTFPDFSGATQSGNLEEAMSNAKEFLDSMLAYYIDENIDLPVVSDIKEVQKEFSEEMVFLIQVDPSRYLQEK